MTLWLRCFFRGHVQIRDELYVGYTIESPWGVLFFDYWVCPLCGYNHSGGRVI